MWQKKISERKSKNLLHKSEKLVDVSTDKPEMALVGDFVVGHSRSEV